MSKSAEKNLVSGASFANVEIVGPPIDRDDSAIERSLVGSWYSDEIAHGTPMSYVSEMNMSDDEKTWVTNGLVAGVSPFVNRGTWSVEDGTLEYYIAESTIPNLGGQRFYARVMDIDGEKVVYQDTQKILVNYRVDDQRMHDKLIGDWEGAECSGGTSYSYVTRYTDDGHWRSEGTMVSGKVSMEYENEGTWTLSGGVLERKVTRSNLPHLQGGVLTSKILFMTTDTMAVRDSDGQAVYSFKVAHNMVSSDRDEVLALNQLGSWRGVETFDAVQYRYVTTFSRDGRWLTRGVQAADGVTKEYQEEGGWEVKGGKLRYRIDLPTTPKTRDLTLSHEIFYTTVGTGMYGTPGANRIYLYQVSDHEVPIM